MRDKTGCNAPIGHLSRQCRAAASEAPPGPPAPGPLLASPAHFHATLAPHPLVRPSVSPPGCKELSETVTRAPTHKQNKRAVQHARVELGWVSIQCCSMKEVLTSEKGFGRVQQGSNQQQLGVQGGRWMSK